MLLLPAIFLKAGRPPGVSFSLSTRYVGVIRPFTQTNAAAISLFANFLLVAAGDITVRRHLVFPRLVGVALPAGRGGRPSGLAIGYCTSISVLRRRPPR